MDTLHRLDGLALMLPDKSERSFWLELIGALIKNSQWTLDYLPLKSEVVNLFLTVDWLSL